MIAARVSQVAMPRGSADQSHEVPTLHGFPLAETTYQHVLDRSGEAAMLQRRSLVLNRRLLQRSSSRARLRYPERRAPLGIPDYRVQRLLSRDFQTQPQRSVL
jgi:hypothetical protein